MHIWISTHAYVDIHTSLFEGPFGVSAGPLGACDLLEVIGRLGNEKSFPSVIVRNAMNQKELNCIA